MPIDSKAMESIKNYIRAQTKWADDWHYNSLYQQRTDFDAQIDQQRAIGAINNAWLALGVLAEELENETLRSAIATERSNATENPLSAEMAYDEPFLVSTATASKYLYLIDLAYPTADRIPDDEITPLVRLLENSGGYLVDRKIFPWVPIDERDVHERLESLLERFYPGVLTKPTVNKPIKELQADTGIKQLGTLIEYKYYYGLAGAKKAQTEILEDLSGYQDDQWHHLVFVLYDVAHVRPTSHWEKLIEAAKPATHAVPIVIDGIPPQKLDRSRSRNHRKESAAKRKAS